MRLNRRGVVAVRPAGTFQQSHREGHLGWNPGRVAVPPPRPTLTADMAPRKIRRLARPRRILGLAKLHRAIDSSGYAIAVAPRSQSLPVRRRPVWAALVAAVVLAIAGFGALLAFWLAGDHDPALPGLFFYRAASFGDSLLLPVLAGCLVGGLAALKCHRPHAERQWGAIAGSVGLATGIFAQWLWLADDNPALNWTLPEPHVLTAAGWYHAGFFCLSLALFSGSITIFARRLHIISAEHADAQSLRRSPFAPAFFAALLGFFFLVVSDLGRVEGGTSRHVTLALVLAGIGAALVLLIAVGIDHARALAPSVATGSLLGIGLMLAVDAPPDASPSLTGWTMAACFCVGLAACEPLRASDAPERRAQWAVATIGASLVLFGSWRLSLQGDTFLAGDETFSLAYVFIGPALLVGYLHLLKAYPSDGRAWLAPLQISGPPLVLAVTGGLAEWPDFDSPNSSVILAYAATLLPLTLVGANFGKIIAAEEAYRDGVGNPPLTLVAMEQRTQSAWLIMIAWTLAGIIAIVKITATFTDLKLGAPEPEGEWAEVLSTLLVGSVSLTVIGGAILFARPQTRNTISLAPSGALCWCLSVGIVTWWLGPFVTGSRDLEFGAAALAAGVAVALFHFETLHSDVARMHDVDIPLRARVLLTATAIAVGTNVAWLVADAAWIDGEPVRAETLGDATLIVLLVGGVLSIGVGVALHNTSEWGRLTIQPVAINLRQNILAFHLAVIVGVAVPVALAQRLDEKNVATLSLALLSIIGVGSLGHKLRSGFSLASKQTAEHTKREMERPPLKLLAIAAELRQAVTASTVDELNNARLVVIKRHMRFMIVVTACLMIGGWSSLVSYLWMKEEGGALALVIPSGVAMALVAISVMVYRKNLVGAANKSAD